MSTRRGRSIIKLEELHICISSNVYTAIFSVLPSPFFGAGGNLGIAILTIMCTVDSGQVNSLWVLGLTTHLSVESAFHEFAKLY